MFIASHPLSYQTLPPLFHAPATPTPVASANMIAFNEQLALDLDLDVSLWRSSKGLAVIAGNEAAPMSAPLAMAYAGHQFAHFVPSLGDGRAILLGEAVSNDGTLYDIQLKGAGRTPFSRTGDGRAAIGPVLREYILSEAMHALGVPTTRALAAIASGEPVLRETALPGAVLTRVAASHIRVGTFEYAAHHGGQAAVQQLADYVIARHYPKTREDKQPYLGMLRAICDRQAALIAQWMLLGFVHGVMNTDNMTISGETIDYGPCAFMESYDPNTVFSYIDKRGRYAYGNQPHIAMWNMSQLAQHVGLLCGEPIDDVISDIMQYFSEQFNAYWMDGMCRKIGLTVPCDDALILVKDMLAIMQASATDYTQFFCALAEALVGNDTTLLMICHHSELPSWIVRWKALLSEHTLSFDAAYDCMLCVNPRYIPRNHLVQRVITAAEHNADYSAFYDLLKVVRSPYESADAFASDYAHPAQASERVTTTFCGT